jgi:predicted GNAT superfamily acetyltransferase
MHNGKAQPQGLNAAELRPLETTEEYAACVRLQRDTWGRDCSELVPPALLQVTQKAGGIAAGAFDAAGLLVGFVYGVTGVKEGRLVHWSHMLAVRQGCEGMGLGRRLKTYQRERLLELGIEVSYWSFDPLAARNAHLNLNRLGVSVTQYVPNMYGDTGSELHSGLGTDRFLVEWRLTSKRVAHALSHGRPPDPPVPAHAPMVALDTDTASGAEQYAADPVVRIAIPEDIQHVKAESADLGWRWREMTRRAFRWYLERGYEVRGFQGGAAKTCCYVLALTGAGDRQ